MMRRVSTTIYLDPEQAEQLKLISEQTKVPVAALVREGIDLMLAKRADETLSLEEDRRQAAEARSLILQGRKEPAKTASGESIRGRRER